ncbi:MAG TPA: GNAT family N-acetyltransferase [Nocardioidaceae bacterium]|nr:GNAT family N-acetyltransferase [Nocardioidaceae bacterium]
MTLTVRPVHTEELAEVGELTVRSYAADGFLDGDDRYVHQLRDAVTRAREAEVYVAALPECPDRIVGTVTFCPQGSPWSELARPGEGEFRMLAVAPEARGRGVARALVGVCLERSRELGYSAVVLSSLPVQHTAHRLYGRLGFRRMPDLDWSPAEGVSLLGFRLDLS